MAPTSSRPDGTGDRQCEPETPADMGVGRCRRRVLVVEDEEPLRLVIEGGLRRLGYDADGAADGAEGLGMAVAGDYDAMVCDIRMPGMGGEELYGCLRQLDVRAARCVVFMTGDAADPATEEFLVRVAAPHIRKPFSLMSLAQLLEEVLCDAAGSE